MDDYDRVMAVNLRSQVVLARVARPHLRAGGVLVLVSSLSALRGNGAISAYALAKAGVSQLARNLAVEWGPQGLRCNAIAPVSSPPTCRAHCWKMPRSWPGAWP
jgi:NAD(P)-dependent dehydrogenase (short-subunit alcohol dehydrogenase family)